MKKFLPVISLILLLAVGSNRNPNNSSNYRNTSTYEFEGEKQTIETVKVFTPTSGEKVKRRTTYVVSWKLSINENLIIALCANGVSCKIIASDVPNTCTYIWFVGDEPPGNYKIQVYPSGGRERVGSSQMFSVED